MFLSEDNAFLVFINWAIYLYIFFTIRPVLHGKTLRKENIRTIKLVILLFCLFSFWGTDWFHYKELIEYLSKTQPEYQNTQLESAYLYMLPLINYNYWLFRVIVWGAALLMFFDTSRRLSVSQPLVLLIFGCGYLCWFSYGRVSLAMSMVFYGASLFYKPYLNKTLLSFLLGVLFIGCSLFFHKTALFAVLIVIISLCMMHLNRRWLLLLLFLTPILMTFIQNYLGEFLFTASDSDYNTLNQITASGQVYANMDIRTIGVGERIRTILETLPYFLLAFMSLKVHVSNTYKDIDKDIQFFSKVIFLIVFIAFLFRFDYDMNTSAIYGRFLRFGLIPASFVASYFYERRIYPRLAKLTVYIAILGGFYTLTYALYCSLVA